MMVKWRAKSGWAQIFQVSSHHSVATEEVRKPYHIPEAGNKEFYPLPSKYSNIHLATPVMGSIWILETESQSIIHMHPENEKES